jgi:hypothetical protein
MQSILIEWIQMFLSSQTRRLILHPKGCVASVYRVLDMEQ